MAGWLCVAITAMQDEICIANGLILCRKLRCDTRYFFIAGLHHVSDLMNIQIILMKFSFCINYAKYSA